jgi:AraC-like DNA-binding protein
MKGKLIPISLVTCLVLLLVAWGIFHYREVRIFPLADESSLRFYSYTDSADQGTSQGRAWIQNGRMMFTYKLASGFQYPYVGMGFDLTTQDSATGKVTSYLNLEGFDSVRIKLRSTNSQDIRFQILTNDPAITRSENPRTQRTLVQGTSMERGWVNKSISIVDFSIPEWWYAINKIKPDYSSRTLDRAAHFDIQSGSLAAVGISDTIEIEEIVFIGENRSLAYVLAGIAFLLLGAFGLLTWLERERLRTDREAQIAARRESAIGAAEKIPLSSHRTEDAKRILEYIGKNYADSELDLDRVCRETGVNRNRLSAILKEEVGTTFKGHLTDLRLSEANRALSETDLQVTEIAYKVGFGNVSHFNRVFKEHFEITPVEFRRSQKKDPNASK